MARIRAVAIVIKDGQLLVMHRRNQGKEYFTLPSGGVEPSETVEEAVLREIAEETSLVIRVERQVYQHDYDDGTSQRFYVCTYISGTPHLAAASPEARDALGQLHEPLWLSLAKLASTLLYPLEIRDWLIHDVKTGFSEGIKIAELSVKLLRQQ